MTSARIVSSARSAPRARGRIPDAAATTRAAFVARPPQRSLRQNAPEPARDPPIARRPMRAVRPATTSSGTCDSARTWPSRMRTSCRLRPPVPHRECQGRRRCSRSRRPARFPAGTHPAVRPEG